MKVKPNFKVLGPRCGRDMKAVTAMLTQLQDRDIKVIMSGGSFVVCGYDITLADVIVDPAMEVPEHGALSEDGKLLVVLDIDLDEDLIAGGFARELTTRVNALRREVGFNVTQHVQITMHCDDMMFAVMSDAFCKVRASFMDDTCCDKLTLISPKNLGVEFSGGHVHVNKQLIQERGLDIKIAGIASEDINDMHVFVDMSLIV